MDYETFESIMTEIKEVNDFQDHLMSICKDFNRNNHSGSEADFYLPDLSCTCVKLLEQIFDDKYDWISYYMWELDFGRAYKDGMITRKDGSNIRLESFRDLYDLLIENMLNCN